MATVELDDELVRLGIARTVDISTKVDVIPGKGLSTNDYTTIEKQKLAGISAGATVNAADAALLSRANHTGTQAISTVSGLQTALDTKVPVDGSKVLSTNDYTTAEKTKLTGLSNYNDTALAARVTATETSIATKVDKVAGQGLSDANYTASEKAKLAGLTDPMFRGTFVSAAALLAGVAIPVAGNYADVDAAGVDAVRYIWDATDSKWVQSTSTATPLTAAQVKSLYESNPDTNAYTSAEKTKLSGIATGATANDTDANLKSRANHTGTQAISTVTGLQTALDGKVAIVSGKDLSSNDYTAAEKTKLSGVATGATANSTDAVLLSRANHTGTQAISTVSGLQTALDTKVTVQPGLVLTTNDYTTDEKTKLAGIAAGATVNSTDTALRDRTTHTGTQAISTVTGLQTALDGKVATVSGKVLSTNDYTTAEQTKLAGIASGATANSTDAALRDRTTHTGSQPISSITGLALALTPLTKTMAQLNAFKASKNYPSSILITDPPAGYPIPAYSDGVSAWRNYAGTVLATDVFNKMNGTVLTLLDSLTGGATGIHPYPYYIMQAALAESKLSAFFLRGVLAQTLGTGSNLSVGGSANIVPVDGSSSTYAQYCPNGIGQWVKPSVVSTDAISLNSAEFALTDCDGWFIQLSTPVTFNVKFGSGTTQSVTIPAGTVGTPYKAFTAVNPSGNAVGQVVMSGFTGETVFVGLLARTNVPRSSTTLSIINFAIAGKSTAQYNACVNVGAWYTAMGVTRAWVCTGTNDLLSTVPLSRAGVRTSWATLLDNLSLAQSNIAWIRPNQNAMDLNGIWEEFATARPGMKYASVLYYYGNLAVFQTNGWISADNVHPNDTWNAIQGPVAYSGDFLDNFAAMDRGTSARYFTKMAATTCIELASDITLSGNVTATARFYKAAGRAVYVCAIASGFDAFLEVTPAGAARFRSGSNQIASADAAVPDGKWVELVYTRTGTQIVIQMRDDNGILQQIANATLNASDMSIHFIGGGTSGGRMIDGCVAYLKLTDATKTYEWTFDQNMDTATVTATQGGVNASWTNRTITDAYISKWSIKSGNFVNWFDNTTTFGTAPIWWNGGTATNIVAPTTVTVSPKTVSMAASTTQQLTATVVPTGALQSVRWTTSNSAIATVNYAGLVTSVAVGSATITATTPDGTKTDTSAITVTAAVIAPTGVTVSPTTASVQAGKTQQLTATVTPTGASQVVTWTTSNSAVATVSSSGLVTGIVAGSATITATTGSFTATTAVTITAADPTGVTVSPTTASANVGSTQQLTATVAPSNASQSVTWTTSNSAVATVNSSGLVTMVAAGTATITATTVTGAKTATSAITVTAVTPTGVSVSPSTASVTAGNTQQLTATVTPSNAPQTVTWTSSNTAIATVNSSGLVTTVAAGSATITATTATGSKTATSAITVTAAVTYPAEQVAPYLLASNTAITPVTQVTTARPLSHQSDDRWTLDPAFSDDFTTFDDTKWYSLPSVPYVNGEMLGRIPARFTKNNVFIDNGMLAVRMRQVNPAQTDLNADDYDPATGMDQPTSYGGYTSGCVLTKALTGYGYFEIKAKIMKSAGSSAFWLAFPDASNPQTEIDVFEMGGKGTTADPSDNSLPRLPSGNRYNMNYHLFEGGTVTNGYNEDRVWVAPFNFADDYHVYGLSWDADYIRWYIDGVLIHVKANMDHKYPMKIVLDSEAFWGGTTDGGWFGFPDNTDLPSNFNIDYIRTWRKSA